MSESKEIKVILLGEEGVGKTNLIRVAMGGTFVKNSKTTLSSAYYDGQIDFNEKTYQYCLWDTAGQEVYRSLNKIFIKDSKIIIIVFSIIRKETFTSVDFWVNYVKEILQNDTYIMALVGNKIDLYDEQEIPDEEIEKKAKELKLKLGMTSALTDAQGFKKFLKELLEDYIITYNPKEIPHSETFMIKNKKPKKKNEKDKCC